MSIDQIFADWIDDLPESPKGERAEIFASSLDDDFYGNPHRVHVCGYWGDPVLSQFSGAGPSPAEMSFKALVVDGIVYQPDPNQDRKAQPRRWVPMRRQPSKSHLRPANRRKYNPLTGKFE